MLSATGNASKRRTGATDPIKRQVALQTPGDALIRLRCALRNDTGADRDHAEGVLPALMQMTLTNDESEMPMVVTIRSAFSLLRPMREWAMEALRRSYEDAEVTAEATAAPLAPSLFGTAGFGTAGFAAGAGGAGPVKATAAWGAAEEGEAEELLSEEGARFLLAEDAEGGPLGLVNFRFSLTGEAVGRPEGSPCAYVRHVLVDPAWRRRGLGQRLLTLLELCASRASMEKVVVALPLARGFDLEGLLEKRGYATDDTLTSFAAEANTTASDDDDDGENLDPEGDEPEFRVFSDHEFFVKAVRPRPFVQPGDGQADLVRLRALFAEKCRVEAELAASQAASAPTADPCPVATQHDASDEDQSDERRDSAAPAADKESPVASAPGGKKQKKRSRRNKRK